MSFSLERGEALALVGESGSGKSVTALSLVRLLPYPAASHPSGEIFFKGEDVLKMTDAQLRGMRGDGVTMVFQEPMTSLNPLHTIERQIGEIIALHGGERLATRAQVVSLLTEVGIVDPASRLGAYPHQLSGGQRQRVMIAMALANRPDLFIADEPTTALDVTVQAQILKLLAELQAKRGMAMLFITHDLGIVRKVAERCRGDAARAHRRGGAGRARVFAHPAASLHQGAARRRAQGRSACPTDPAAPVVLERRGRQGLVPDQARSPPAHGRSCEGGRRRLASPCAKARRSASSANPARARRRSASRSCG